MAAKKLTKPKANQDQVAMAIAASKITSVLSAARQFHISAQTIFRYTKEIEDGTNPELAEKVDRVLAHQAKKQEATLDSLFQAMLERLSELTPKATYDQVLAGCDKISEIKITKDRLSNLNIETLPKPPQGNNGQVNDRSDTTEGSQMGETISAAVNINLPLDSNNN
jgi:hypothetical protein